MVTGDVRFTYLLQEYLLKSLVLFEILLTRYDAWTTAQAIN